jgi:spore maturation protein CgeB
MRILFLSVDYPQLLEEIYSGGAGAREPASFGTLRARRNATLFSRCDYLVDALAKLGHEGIQVYVNNLPLQQAWRREYSTSCAATSFRSIARQAVFLLRRAGSHGKVLLNRTFGDGRLARQPEPMFDSRNPLIEEIIAEQIRHYRPDVVYNYDPMQIDARFLAGLKSDYGALVGQIAAPFAADFDWTPYDLVTSSLPNFVEQLRTGAIRSAYLPLYFAPAIVNEVGAKARDLPLTFVGSVSAAHSERSRFLEGVAEAVPLAVYGLMEGSSGNGGLKRVHRGPALGRSMYDILARSGLTLNRHIDVARGNANNLRLFEATGMGACLLTERTGNLPDLFEPGREVVAYDGIEECVDLCRYYLKDMPAAMKIAEAGQRRCLSDHSVDRHAERLVAVLRQHA